jgi:hypothetical protein
MNNVNAITETALSAFYGSETFYRHSLARSVIFTEGCAFLSLNGAGWLIDEIALVQNTKALIGEGFQSWKLLVDCGSSSAVLIATDGGASEDADGHAIYKELYRKQIPFTDFPLKSISLYCCANGETVNGKTIMLPSEY